MSFDPERFTTNLISVAEKFLMPFAYVHLEEDEEEPETPLLPTYQEWTKTGQEMGVIADPHFALRMNHHLKRGKVITPEVWEQEKQRIRCWNGYVNVFHRTFKGLGIPFPHSLRYLTPIPTPNAT